MANVESRAGRGLDERNDLFDTVVPPEYVCGGFGEEGRCVRDAIVTCTDGRFEAVDCQQEGYRVPIAT